MSILSFILNYHYYFYKLGLKTFDHSLPPPHTKYLQNRSPNLPDENLIMASITLRSYSILNSKF